MKGLVSSATAILAFSTTLAFADAPAVDFDKGVDASAVLSQAKDTAAKDASAPIKASYIGQTRYDRDCVRFTFSPTDPAASDAVWLRSQEWVTECTPVGDPQHGGGQSCWEHPGMSYQEQARITLQNRQPLLPWEHDAFTVCMEGPWLSIYQNDTAYDYKRVSGGTYDGNFVMTPVKKIPMNADPAGITAQTFSPNLRLLLADKWFSYYAGEKTVIKVTLKKVVTFWPDATIFQKELTFDPAANYAIDAASIAAAQSQKLEAGKKYYVQYSFQRLGKVSTDKWTKTVETEKLDYQPAAAAVGR